MTSLRSIFHRFIPLLFVFLLATGSLASAGEPIRLWDAKGEALPGYGGAVRRLPPGAEIVLQEGTPPIIAKIVKFLGNGNTSVIYEIEGGKALRLAKGEGLSPFGATFEAYILWFAEGAERLERTEAPVVKVFQNESIRTRYLVVEKLLPPEGVDTLYSLEDLVKGRVADPDLRTRMTRELLDDFAPKTWQVRFVADMRSEQILYTSRGWLIADLSSTVNLAHGVRDATLFSAMGTLPPQWRLRIEKRVLAARREAELNGNFAQLVLSEFRRCLGWLKGSANF